MDVRGKKLLALMTLASLWAGLLIWQFLNWEGSVRVPLANVTGTGGRALHSPNGMDGLHVQLDLLAAARTQREMTFATPRNIFALPSAAAVNEVKVSDVSPESADRAVLQQAVAAELSQFHYLGFVRTGEEWQRKHDLAVLTKNDDVHVVKKGETVENHVVVKTITRESVTLLDKDSRLEYTVLLLEEPQTPSP
jgi:hypothetical protein